MPGGVSVTVGLDGKSMDSIREKWLIPREPSNVAPSNRESVSTNPPTTAPTDPPAKVEATVLTEGEVDAAFAQKPLTEAQVDEAFAKKDLTERQVDAAFNTLPIDLSFEGAVAREDNVPLMFRGDLEQIQLPKKGILEDDFDVYPPELTSFLESDEGADEAAVDAAFDIDLKKFEGGTLVSSQSEQQAVTSHYNQLKSMENPEERGLVKGKTGDRFMPFESAEGRGPDKSMSKFEIGYGIKVPEKWFSKDKKNWPVVDGVPLDISKGATREQADSMLRSAQENSRKSAKKRLTKWDDMTEGERVFWTDLTYNGGAGAIDKNPKAKALANKGFTTEAMIAALDFIRSAGELSRGLLNRRVSLYNQAAVEVNGAPIIEEYKFSQGSVDVKFAHKFMTNTVSPAFEVKNGKGGWLNIITKDAGEPKAVTKKMDRNHNFTG